MPRFTFRNLITNWLIAVGNIFFRQIRFYRKKPVSIAFLLSFWSPYNYNSPQCLFPCPTLKSYTTSAAEKSIALVINPNKLHHNERGNLILQPIDQYYAFLHSFFEHVNNFQPVSQKKGNINTKSFSRSNIKKMGD